MRKLTVVETGWRVRPTADVFGQEAVVVAYATTGATGELSEGRRKALCKWTMEALKDTGFAVCRTVIFMTGIFFKNLAWYRPDSERSTGLFEE